MTFPTVDNRAARFKWSIRTALTMVVLGGLLPAVMAAVALVYYQYHEGRAQLEEDTMQTARALQLAVDSHLLKVQAVGQALAESDSLRDGNLEAFHAKARKLLEIEGLTSNIVLRDQQGAQVLNARRDFGSPLPQSPSISGFNDVFDSGRIVVSDIYMGVVTREPIVSILVPVYSKEKVIYALSLGVSSATLSNILSNQTLPQGWVVAALDSSGRIFARNIDPHIHIGRTATSQLYESMVSRLEGVLYSETQEGTRALTVHTRSPQTGWSVAIGIPQHQLESVLIRRIAMLAAGIAASFGLGIFLAWFMSRKIAGSMRRLAEAAAALGRGEPTPVVSMPYRESQQVAIAMGQASDLLQARENELKEAHRLARIGTWHWNIQTGEVQTSESIVEIYGREVPSFADQRGTLLPEASWNLISASMEEAVSLKKGYDLEFQVLHGDGHLIWINAKAEPVMDGSGEVIALRGTTQDITERKTYEEALRNSETAARNAAYEAEAERRRLAAVLEATPVAVTVADAAGRVIEFNAASKDLWGTNHPHPGSVNEYAEGRGWWADGSERHGEALQAHEWPMARALRGEDATRDIIEIAPFDDPDDRRIVLMSGAVIRDAKGNILGGVTAQLDITDRMEAEEELREADRRKDEFLAMLAHELRNPLAPISAAAELLQLGVGDSARIRQTSAVISRQVKHMASLVDDLLDVSRVTRGLVTLQHETVDANRMVTDAVEQVKPQMNARRHTLNLRLLDQPAPVSGDPKRLVQIMVNLLNNAAKFTPDGGMVTVSIEDDGQQYSLSVEDNGIGMTPELQARAFGLFAQGERTPDRSQGGLGIGLALVKSLVELHGGRVSVESEGAGKGSRFLVCLPKAQNAAISTDADRSGAFCTRTQALKVLIVDDNTDAATTLAMLVESLGHQAYVEHRSDRALERAPAFQPDVCLLDIGLPEIDGKQLARRLREMPELAHTVFVAVTGYGQEQERQSILQAGFAHHFTKPVDLSTLADMLESIAD